MFVPLLIASLVAGAPAQDPNVRYEFLRRLSALEYEWRAQGDEATRVRALPHVESAAQRLFADEVANAAKELDEARSILAGRTQCNWAHAWSVTPQRRLLDTNAHEMALDFRTLWWPCKLESLVLSSNFDGKRMNALVDCTEPGSYVVPAVDCEGASGGDHTLQLWISDRGAAYSSRNPMVSLVENRDARLAALGKAIDALPKNAPQLECETAKSLHTLLTSLAKGSTESHDYPGARLLAEAEQVVAAAAQGERWYGPQRDGEQWLAILLGESAIRVRVFVPAGISAEKPVPLVLALHGAAFDEDTWFDGYGNGAIVELCRARGWMLAAPRTPADTDAQRLEAITSALASTYPLDRTRVFAVGHSRGGGVALRAHAEAPRQFRAVATIGAALSPGEARKLADRPLFLAAGDHDPALEPVRAMHAALREAGAQRAELRVCANAEHWLAVQAALPEVFEWLDRVVE